MSDRTPYELLVELHGLVLHELVRRLKQPNPPTDILAVAGRALRAHYMAPESDADRRLLRRLWRLQLECLLAAVEDTANPPSAATLAEVSRFLSVNGITKDLERGLDETRAAAALTLASRLPFATH